MSDDLLKRLEKFRDMRLDKLEPGETIWGIRVRERLRELARGEEKKFWRMGKLIYEASSKKDPLAEPMFKTWGYTNFNKYCEKELNISGNKARKFARIYEKIEIDVGPDITPGLKARLIRLGPARLQEIVRTLTPENAEEWAHLGRKLSGVAVKARVRAMLKGEEFEIDPSHVSPFTELRYRLRKDEAQVIESALSIARDTTGSKDPASNMLAICLSYITHSEPQHLPTEMLIDELERRGMGVVVLDQNKLPHEIVYGEDALAAMARSHRVHAARADQAEDDTRESDDD